MEVQIQELLTQIKDRGVNAARDEAKGIIDDAKKTAAAIVENAKKEAAKTLDETALDLSRREASHRDALRQASRDVVLGLEKRIQELFSRLLREEVAGALNGQVLADVIVEVIKKWEPDARKGLEVQLSPKQLKDLETLMKSRLADAVKSGVEFKPVSHVEAGFRVGQKNGNAYFDFSAEGILAMVAGLLNPKLAEIITGTEEN